MIGRPLNIDRIPTMASATPVPPTRTPVLTAWRHPVVFRLSTRLDATTSKDIPIPSRSGPLLGERFAEEALRPEHQNHDEQREGNQVPQLVRGGNAQAIKEKRRAHRLDDAEKE